MNPKSTSPNRSRADRSRGAALAVVFLLGNGRSASQADTTTVERLDSGTTVDSPLPICNGVGGVERESESLHPLHDSRGP